MFDLNFPVTFLLLTTDTALYLYWETTYIPAHFGNRPSKPSATYNLVSSRKLAATLPFLGYSFITGWATEKETLLNYFQHMVAFHII